MPILHVAILPFSLGAPMPARWFFGLGIGTGFLLVLATGFSFLSWSVPAPLSPDNPFAAIVAEPADALAAADAIHHVGESVTVCGEVASSRFARKRRGAPTFLNLDEPFPDQVFTILIWGRDRPKFAEAPEFLAGSRVCVTGVIRLYRGLPEMIVSDPGQLDVRR